MHCFKKKITKSLFSLILFIQTIPLFALDFSYQDLIYLDYNNNNDHFDILVKYSSIEKNVHEESIDLFIQGKKITSLSQNQSYALTLLGNKVDIKIMVKNDEKYSKTFSSQDRSNRFWLIQPIIKKDQTEDIIIGF